MVRVEAVRIAWAVGHVEVLSFPPRTEIRAVHIALR